MTRTRLANRRHSTFVSFDHEGVPYTASASAYPSGDLAELFLNCAKEGSSANIVARECAVILSIALQTGAPLQTIREALPKLADGKPAGPVGTALDLLTTPTAPKGGPT